jgi:hypothetical protein
MIYEKGFKSNANFCVFDLNSGYKREIVPVNACHSPTVFCYIQIIMYSIVNSVFVIAVSKPSQDFSESQNPVQRYRRYP